MTRLYRINPDTAEKLRLAKTRINLTTNPLNVNLKTT